MIFHLNLGRIYVSSLLKSSFCLIISGTYINHIHFKSHCSKISISYWPISIFPSWFQIYTIFTLFFLNSKSHFFFFCNELQEHLRVWMMLYSSENMYFIFLKTVSLGDDYLNRILNWADSKLSPLLLISIPWMLIRNLSESL